MSLADEVIHLLDCYPKQWKLLRHQVVWNCKGTLSIWISNGWAFCYIEQATRTPLIDRWRIWRAYKRWFRKNYHEQTLADMGVMCCKDSARDA